MNQLNWVASSVHCFHWS